MSDVNKEKELKNGSNDKNLVVSAISKYLPKEKIVIRESKPNKK